MLELLLMHDCENKRGDKTEVKRSEDWRPQKGSEVRIDLKVRFCGQKSTQRRTKCACISDVTPEGQDTEKASWTRG